MRRTMLVVSVMLASGALMLSAASSALAMSPVGATPQMGWNDWNAYGCTNTAANDEAQAKFIHDSGLQAEGYNYVVNDGCWNYGVGPGSGVPNGSPLSGAAFSRGTSDAQCNVVDGRMDGGSGQIFINPVAFPPTTPCANDGFARVARYVHSLGLKFGLWIDATNDW